MASKRAKRRSQCTGKVRHESKDDAHRAMISMKKYKGLEMFFNVYKCPSCGGWHCGRAPMRKKTRRF